MGLIPSHPSVRLRCSEMTAEAGNNYRTRSPL